MSDIKYSWYHSSKGFKVLNGTNQQLLLADGSTTQINQPNGVATLGSGGKHTPSQYGVEATHEAYQNWGGKHIIGASPIDATLNNRINANRFAFFPANKMVIESSTDGGVTWTGLGVS